MYKNLKILLTVLLTSILFTIGFPVNSKAESSVKNLIPQKQNLLIPNKIEDNYLDVHFKNKFTVNEKEEVELPFSTRSSYVVHDSKFIFSETLTADDSNDWYYFNISSDRTILFEMQSVNKDYYVQLFQVDWDQGMAYPTNLIAPANNPIAYNQLPEGDWALMVTSGETLDDKYTLKMNATNPSGAASIYNSSSSYQYILLEYPDTSIYANGNYIFTKDGANNHLDWERKYDFRWDGNFNQRTHQISSVKVQNISRPVSYQSKYANSNEAVMIYLDKETLFMHFESYFRSGPPTQYESSFVDTIGKLTPRRIDDEDLNNWGDQILIYDLKTGKTIDFFSVLNFYYAGGVEPVPTIKFLN